MKVKGEYVFLKRPTCPDCGREFDACSTADGENNAPGPGDMTLCAYCGGLFVFQAELQLRPPSAEELTQIRQQSGGLTLALASAGVEKYQIHRHKASVRHALYKALTGVWPEEHGHEDGPLEI